MTKLSCSMRLVFLTVSILIWLGIALSGFWAVHWFIYVPAIVTLFVAITSICLGDTLFKKIC